MGAKKKPAEAKKKSAAEEDDISVDQLYRTYKTKKVPEYEVTMLKFMKEKYELYQEEQEKITKFHIWEEMGWAGCRALMDSMKAVQ